MLIFRFETGSFSFNEHQSLFTLFSTVEQFHLNCVSSLSVILVVPESYALSLWPGEI